MARAEQSARLDETYSTSNDCMNLCEFVRERHAKRYRRSHVLAAGSEEENGRCASALASTTAPTALPVVTGATGNRDDGSICHCATADVPTSACNCASSSCTSRKRLNSSALLRRSSFSAMLHFNRMSSASFCHRTSSTRNFSSLTFRLQHSASTLSRRSRIACTCTAKPSDAEADHLARHACARTALLRLYNKSTAVALIDRSRSRLSISSLHFMKCSTTFAALFEESADR